MSRFSRLALIGLGGMNIIHATLHLIQFFQSLLLLSGSHYLESILHNPIFSFFWGIVGVVSLVLGIKDFKHHEKCKN